MGGNTANKHNILMRYYVCCVPLAPCHSLVILYFPNGPNVWTFLSTIWYMYFLFFILFPSMLVFPLSSSRSLYKTLICIRWMRLKYGIVLLTSYISRIAVALFLQFVFVITNNKVECCSRNEIILSISSLSNSLQVRLWDRK